jgi:hypothetical protein
MHETGKVGREDETLEADLLALVLIDRGQLGVMHRREEPDAQAGRPPRRNRGRAAEEDDAVRLRQRRRGDAHSPAPPFERLARPGMTQGLDELLEELGAPRAIDPVHGELLGAVSGAEHHAHASPAG